MFDFKSVKLSDKVFVEKIMKQSCEKGCEYCFGNLYMWSAIYGNKIAYYNDFLLARDYNEKPMYLYPCGNGNKKEIIERLIDYSMAKDDTKLEMYSLSSESVEELNTLFPNKFKFEKKRDYFDYLYLTDDLANLSGKKYHQKRNHIAYFKKNNNWSFEKIDSSNIDECYDMNKKWVSINRDKNPLELDNEQIAVKRAFENYDNLGLLGGLIRANGQVVAYTIGEEINSDVFCTHIEKAYSDVRGAYPIINQEFAKNLLQNYKYINREEDTGSEGLRKAKLSYYPAILLEKYNAKYEG